MTHREQKSGPKKAVIYFHSSTRDQASPSAETMSVAAQRAICSAHALGASAVERVPELVHD